MLTQEEWMGALNARHGKERQEKFSRAVVAVCGLGGLGSNVAIALARAGIGKLILIDFDRVDVTNLNRQQYKASQLGMNKTEALAQNLRTPLPAAPSPRTSPRRLLASPGSVRPTSTAGLNRKWRRTL